MDHRDIAENNRTLVHLEELKQLEAAVLSHHLLIWLLTSNPIIQDQLSWPLVRGIRESNDQLYQSYITYCKSVTGHQLTDGNC